MMELTNKQVLDAQAGLNRLAQFAFKLDEALIIHENIMELAPHVEKIQGIRKTMLAKGNGNKGEEPSEAVTKDWDALLQKTAAYDLHTIEFAALRKLNLEIEPVWLGGLITSGIVKLAEK